MKYRKKPIIIEAYQTDVELDIETLEGVMHANIGDYIITGINGEKYPCKPDIFEKTYELVEEGDSKMTSKEALTELFNEANRFPFEKPKYDTYDLLRMSEQIQKDLEILEIIQNKLVFPLALMSLSYELYNESVIKEQQLTQEEYDKVKAWLLGKELENDK